MRQRMTFAERLRAPPSVRYVYFIGSATGPIKIGRSTDPKYRLRELQTGNHEPLRILAAIETERCHELEREYHARFADHHIRGEWFSRVRPITREINRIDRLNALRHSGGME